MLVLVIALALVVGIMTARTPTVKVHARVRPLFAFLNAAFGFLIVLAAWYHRGPAANACASAAVVVLVLLAAVFRAGGGTFVGK